MLEKIKKFFQSIAGGIASIWNSIKNLWSSNKANLVSDNELSFVELSNGKIGLVMLQDIIFSKNKDLDGNVIDCEFRSDFNDESLYITGRYDSKTIMEDGNICLSINSVGTLDGKEVYGDNEPEEMKRLLLSSKITDLEVKQHATDTSQSLNA
uniref:Uncharacterized protein n=1 Tax=Wolbachia endosymbiont of Aleurodicus floccissimus TaxID=2152762 RepID=A0A3B0JGV2_9RICK